MPTGLHSLDTPFQPEKRKVRQRRGLTRRCDDRWCGKYLRTKIKAAALGGWSPEWGLFGVVPVSSGPEQAPIIHYPAPILGLLHTLPWIVSDFKIAHVVRALATWPLLVACHLARR